MSLTVDQEEKLRFMLAEIGDCMDDLSSWEKNFMNDQIKRYDENGANMFLSGKQWAVLNKIHEKCTDVD